MTIAAVRTPQEIQKQLYPILLKKPNIDNLDDLLDWKEYLWEQQFAIDYRIQTFFHSLNRDEKDNFYDTVILNPYIPVIPFYNQVLLLFSRGSVLYGGARGGGKTEASLMGAIQYVDFPEWKAGIFRLTYPDLSAPGAIMDRAKDWLYENPILDAAGISPHWDEKNKLFTFPSGAKIKFAHVQHEKDALKYQGSEFHHLIFDEAVQISEKKIIIITGSKRKQITDPLPLRTWFTGNPGGVSHDYFKERYVDGPGIFINSKYIDNPYLDHSQYEKQSLDIIKDSDPILYRQWKFGDWEAIPEGKLFKRKWFTERLYDLISERIIKWLRFWDLAATKEEDPNKKGGPDWAAGGLFALGESGKVYLQDMVRYREDEDFVWDEIVRIAQHVDGRHVAVRIEQEGAASGKMVIGRFARDLPGFDVDGHTINRVAKLDRARAWVSFIKHGGFKILEGATWVTTFLNEITVFPTKGIHDDQVDVVSGGLQELFYGVEEQQETIPGVG